MSNVYSRANTAVMLDTTLCDACFNNIQVFADGIDAIYSRGKTQLKNVSFGNIYYHVSDKPNDDRTRHIINFKDVTGENLKFNNINASGADRLMCLDNCEADITAENVNICGMQENFKAYIDEHEGRNSIKINGKTIS